MAPAEKLWESEKGLEKVAAFCRSSKGVPVRSGIERLRNAHDTDRRVEYFRGEKLVNCLLGTLDDDEAKKKKKKDPRPYAPASAEEAKQICAAMMQAGYVHRAQRTGKGQLEWEPRQVWEPRDYYVWDFEGSKGFSNFMTGALIVGILVCTCFPIWPHFLKVYLWYCSVTFLIFMCVFCTVRMILFLNFWIVGYDFWILPNLFDESLTFVDSFKPGYSFDHGAANQRYYRAALLMASFSFFAWAYNQPTDFDAFVEAQQEFIADLYDGKLITDMAQQDKDDIDLVKRPSFEELAMEEEEEAKEREAKEDLEKLHEQAARREEDPDWDPEAEEAAADDMIDQMLNMDDDDDE